ncbi:unnamed protein product [Pleuronectes platessa]|uniref:Uncharacterized protein n=1 Tax=Pleuronectes platessa TaxID=8262 RepID=A0A9N7YKF4_PLEPL|nr:unnamed protein product [Pleuronectes platessa]
MLGKLNKRRVFLEQLGKALVSPFIELRERIPCTELSAVVVKAVKAAAAQRAIVHIDARPERLCGPISGLFHGPSSSPAKGERGVALLLNQPGRLPPYPSPSNLQAGLPEADCKTFHKALTREPALRLQHEQP